MASQPPKPKTRLCLLLGAAVVLFHAVALTTPVSAAKAEQHPLDTHSTPKAAKDRKINIHKLPKTKNKNKKTAQDKTPTIQEDTSLVDTVLEAAKMDAASLQNLIAGLWNNAVLFRKYEAPDLQAKIDQVLKMERVDVSKIQGGRNLVQQQKEPEQDQNGDIELILTRKSRRVTRGNNRQGRGNEKRGQKKKMGVRRQKYGHRKGAGKRRGGRYHRKDRHVGHSDRAPSAPATPAPPANNEQPNVDTGAPVTGDTNVPVNNHVVAAPDPRRPRRKGWHHHQRLPRPIAAQGRQ